MISQETFIDQARVLAQLNALLKCLQFVVLEETPDGPKELGRSIGEILGVKPLQIPAPEHSYKVTIRSLESGGFGEISYYRYNEGV